MNLTPMAMPLNPFYDKWPNKIPENKQEVVKDYVVKIAGDLLNDESPIQDEWLSENIWKSKFIAKHPALAEYLNENPDQAQRIVDNPQETVEVLKEAVVHQADELLNDDSPITIYGDGHKSVSSQASFRLVDTVRLLVGHLCQ